MQNTTSRFRRFAPWLVAATIAFAVTPASSDPAAAVPEPAQASRADTEFALWDILRDTDKVEELQAFIRIFPDSVFASMARAQIADLQRAVAEPNQNAAASRATEDVLNLTRAERRKVQEQLSALGFYDGPQSGFIGASTREAIERWQAARDFPVSGFLNALQYDVLLTEEAAASSSADTPRTERVQRETPTERRAPSARPRVIPLIWGPFDMILPGDFRRLR
jgi:hypothetical protein